MRFELPKHGEIFIDQVLERSKNLINSGIWSGVREVRLDTWMKNFSDDTERYFGACILDALIFRSEDQTIALMEQLFQRTLPDHLRKHPAKLDCKHSWLELLRSPPSKSPPLRIVPVLKENDPPTKSGPVLARLYKRTQSLEEKWIIYAKTISEAKGNNVQNFLFIDDFLGTGKQFCEFADHHKLKSLLDGCYGIYAPLVAHKNGISKVKKHLPGLHVIAVEVIDDRYNLFSEDSEWFNDGTNSAPAAREFYHELAKKFNFLVAPDDMEGVGNLALAYAFSHATPDNCLPLLWANGEKWHMLLER